MIMLKDSVMEDVPSQIQLASSSSLSLYWSRRTLNEHELYKTDKQSVEKTKIGANG